MYKLQEYIVQNITNVPLEMFALVSFGLLRFGTRCPNSSLSTNETGLRRALQACLVFFFS